MTFKRATMIGVCSAGAGVVLSVPYFAHLPIPGIWTGIVRLLADIGLLTFFIVLYQKQKDASR